MGATNSFFSTKTFVLTPGESRPINITGTFVVCLAATAEFNLQVGERSEKIPFNIGLKARCISGDSYTVLVVDNPSIANNTITLLTGNGDVDDQRLNVIATAVIPVTNKDSSTKVKTGAEQTIAGTTTVAHSGNLLGVGGLYRRKSIIVTNMDAALDLAIRDSAGTEIGTVFPRTAWVMATDDDLQIRNNNGGALSIRVSELFYTTA